MIYAFFVAKFFKELICFFFTDFKVWLLAKNFWKLVEDFPEFDGIRALATLLIELVVLF